MEDELIAPLTPSSVSNGFYQSQPPQNAEDSDDTSENWIFETLFCHWNIETVVNLGGPAFAGQKQGQDGPKCADPVTSSTLGMSLDAQDIAVSQILVALEIPSIVFF